MACGICQYQQNTIDEIKVVNNRVYDFIPPHAHGNFLRPTFANAPTSLSVQERYNV